MNKSDKAKLLSEEEFSRLYDETNGFNTENAPTDEALSKFITPSPSDD